VGGGGGIRIEKCYRSDIGFVGGADQLAWHEIAGNLALPETYMDVYVSDFRHTGQFLMI
jgi:hypothetical protein